MAASVMTEAIATTSTSVKPLRLFPVAELLIWAILCPSRVVISVQNAPRASGCHQCARQKWTPGFPRSWIIPYDLSCYACQLNKLDEGRTWLKKAFKLGDPKEVKLLALADPDLKVLWPEIESFRLTSQSEEAGSAK